VFHLIEYGAARSSSPTKAMDRRTKD